MLNQNFILMLIILFFILECSFKCNSIEEFGRKKRGTLTKAQIQTGHNMTTCDMCQKSCSSSHCQWHKELCFNKYDKPYDKDCAEEKTYIKGTSSKSCILKSAKNLYIAYRKNHSDIPLTKSNIVGFIVNWIAEYDADSTIKSKYTQLAVDEKKQCDEKREVERQKKLDEAAVAESEKLATEKKKLDEAAAIAANLGYV